MLRSPGCRSLTRSSLIRISPPLIVSRPAIMRRSVDLPQPDGPTRTMNSPSPISSETSLTAMTLPLKRFVTPSRTIWAIGRSPWIYIGSSGWALPGSTPAWIFEDTRRSPCAHSGVSSGKVAFAKTPAGEDVRDGGQLDRVPARRRRMRGHERPYLVEHGGPLLVGQRGHERDRGDPVDGAVGRERLDVAEAVVLERREQRRR